MKKVQINDCKTNVYLKGTNFSLLACRQLIENPLIPTHSHLHLGDINVNSNWKVGYVTPRVYCPSNVSIHFCYLTGNFRFLFWLPTQTTQTTQQRTQDRWNKETDPFFLVPIVKAAEKRGLKFIEIGAKCVGLENVYNPWKWRFLSNLIWF